MSCFSNVVYSDLNYATIGWSSECIVHGRATSVIEYGICKCKKSFDCEGCRYYHDFQCDTPDEQGYVPYYENICEDRESFDDSNKNT